MASAVARAYNGGLGAEPPAGSSAEPVVEGSGGEAPLKLKASDVYRYIADLYL